MALAVDFDYVIALSLKSDPYHELKDPTIGNGVNCVEKASFRRASQVFELSPSE